MVAGRQPRQCRALHGAYALFREAGDVTGAVECALWLAITYKANFANFAAANGWIARAERLLEPIEPGPAHGWAWVTRAYRMTDLDAAEALTATGARPRAGGWATSTSSSPPRRSSG